MTKELLVSGPPRDTENLMGYLVRMTEWNDYDTVSWVLETAGLTWFTFWQCSFVFNTEIDLSPLARLFGASREELERLRYPQSPDNAYRSAVLGQPVQQYMIRVASPKVCPACLAESNYYRAVWDLAPLTACPHHGCLLLDACPGCGKALSWKRNKVAVCSNQTGGGAKGRRPWPQDRMCGYDWREASTAHVGEQGLALSRQVYRLCGMPGTEAWAAPTGFPPVLLGQPLEELLAAVNCVAAHRRGVNDTTGRYSVPGRGNAELHEFFSEGLALFESWPSRFHDYLGGVCAARRRAKHGPGATRRDFGSLPVLLYRRLPYESLQFLRDGYASYLQSRWDGVLLHPSTVRMTGLAPAAKNYLARNELVTGLGIGDYWIDRMTREGKLDLVVRKNGKSSYHLYKREEAERLRDYLKGLLETTAVAGILNVNRVLIPKMVAAGLLTPLHGPTVDDFPSYLFEESAVRGLLSDVEATVTARVAKPRGALTIKQAVFKITSAGVTVPSFLLSVLKGEIRPCGKTRQPGLDAFAFDRAEVEAYLRARRQGLVGNRITVGQAAKLLGVNPTATYHIVRRGLLHVVQWSTGKGRAFMTTPEAVDEFNSTYVLLSKPASEMGTTIKTLAGYLAKAGVMPVISPADGKEVPFVFKKADLERVNVGELVLAGKAGSDRLGRGLDLITDAQVAARLGVDLAAVVRLVRSRALKPRRIVPSGGNTLSYLFSRREVARYCGKSIRREGMVTANEAAKMLGLKRSTFMDTTKWGRSLRRVRFDFGLNKVYFYRDDVEALARVRRDAVTCGEAAKMLGVTSWTVSRWVKRGKVAAVAGPGIDNYGIYLIPRAEVERLLAKMESAEAPPLKDAA